MALDPAGIWLVHRARLYHCDDDLSDWHFLPKPPILFYLDCGHVIHIAWFYSESEETIRQDGAEEPDSCSADLTTCSINRE